MSLTPTQRSDLYAAYLTRRYQQINLHLVAGAKIARWVHGFSKWLSGRHVYEHNRLKEIEREQTKQKQLRGRR